MTEKWNAQLHKDVPWQQAYASVEAAVIGLMATPAMAERRLTTNELVEALYPESLARGDGIDARNRIYKALMALAPRGLACYASRGEERKRAHSNIKIRPWIWHAASQPNTEHMQRCPKCGQEIF